MESVIFYFDTTIQIGDRATDQDNLQILSFARQARIQDLKELSFPISNALESKVKFTHYFVEHCSIMKTADNLLFFVFIFWGLITVLHFTWTWIMYKQHSKYIQKLMIFIPIFFIIDNLIDYVYWNACPWISNGGQNVRYLAIIQIAIVTVFNTFFVGFVTFVSKGWAIMRNQFTRDELSSMSMIVAIFYLVYSAYIIASDIRSLKVIIVVILACMHVWVIFHCSVNIRKNLKIIDTHLDASVGDETVRESLYLKRFILRSFWGVIVAFFLLKILNSCLD